MNGPQIARFVVSGPDYVALVETAERVAARFVPSGRSPRRFVVELDTAEPVNLDRSIWTATARVYLGAVPPPPPADV